MNIGPAEITCALQTFHCHFLTSLSSFLFIKSLRTPVYCLLKSCPHPRGFHPNLQSSQFLDPVSRHLHLFFQFSCPLPWLHPCIITPRTVPALKSCHQISSFLGLPSTQPVITDYTRSLSSYIHPRPLDSLAHLAHCSHHCPSLSSFALLYTQPGSSICSCLLPAPRV